MVSLQAAQLLEIPLPFDKENCATLSFSQNASESEIWSVSQYIFLPVSLLNPSTVSLLQKNKILVSTSISYKALSPNLQSCTLSKLIFSPWQPWLPAHILKYKKDLFAFIFPLHYHAIISFPFRSLLNVLFTPVPITTSFTVLRLPIYPGLWCT